MWQHYYQPTSLAEALGLLRELHGAARVVAGGTDVLVELERTGRRAQVLVDITRLAELQGVRQEGDVIRIGGLATHADVLASDACVAGALPLAQACLELGAPQIRARATVAGNLATASPANDTITPLLALGAEVRLLSAAGERSVPLAEFYTGFRRTALRPDELIGEVRVPAMRPEQRGLFIKLGLRRAQAISVINLAVLLTLDGDSVADARVAMGCLAPTVVRAPRAEAFLQGRRLDAATCAEAGRLACEDARPIDDVRGSAAYRLATLRALLAEGLRRIAAGEERAGWPARIVRLETARGTRDEGRGTRGEGRGTRGEGRGTRDEGRGTRGESAAPLAAVAARVNGREVALDPRKTLLDALREDASLTGTKVGCEEGECGACTVWLGGQAVMACLTPAGQAHGADVTTIEGLAGDALHPLQRAFVRHAAVQCGYCIPGMIMAGAKLLDEHDAPSDDEIRTALSGNICRCTGYRKILDAVRAAAGETTPQGAV